ncbi:cupin domain-containing protein [Natronomonas sp. EA1]|uniref:cupin domain-containing protein n=1 Tax=Natronomonas sp. EA1 TaxID=3421655 RepID=UPI003EBF3F72
MKKIAIEDVRVENNPLGVHSVRKPVSKAIKTTDFAMNYFELKPGESFSGGIHTHHDQEEVFYVEEGTATFEVLARQVDGEEDEPNERAEIVVEAGEVIRFAPGEFQTGVNTGEKTLVGWAFGAPGSHDWEELESLIGCRECGEETRHALELTDEARFENTCKECGNTFTL